MVQRYGEFFISEIPCLWYIAYPYHVIWANQTGFITLTAYHAYHAYHWGVFNVQVNMFYYYINYLYIIYIIIYIIYKI